MAKRTVFVYRGNRHIKTFVIPEGVVFIGDAAFKGCSSLRSVTIPESVTSIGEDVFEGCTSLDW